MSTAANICFHCGLTLTAGPRYELIWQGQVRPMCCAGCRAVAETIIEHGGEDYYLRRQKPAQPLEQLPPPLPDLPALDHPALRSIYVQQQGQRQHAQLSLAGMTCPACAWLIENCLQRLPGLQSVNVNITSERLTVSYDERLSLVEIIATIEAIGYRASPFQIAGENAPQKNEKREMLRLAIAGLGALQAMMFAMGLYLGAWQNISALQRDFLRLITFFVATPVVFYAGWPFYRRSWQGLRHAHMNMDLPLSLAVLSTYTASVYAMLRGQGETYFDSVSMLIFIVSSGRFIELRARRRAGEIQANIEALAPRLAWRLADGQVQRVSTLSVACDDLLLVKPGERVPCDGELMTAEAQVDESLLSGESLPVPKRCGQRIVAGSLNLAQALQIRVTAGSQDSTLAQLQQLLSRAQAGKPKLALLADRIAAWIVLGLLLVAAATWFYWQGHDPSRALWSTIAVLVATCPCALSLAIPMALTYATTALAREGLLIARGHVLDQLVDCDTVVFDKTGTLSTGQLQCTTIQTQGLSHLAVLDIAHALEAHSQHPIARAFHAHTPSSPRVALELQQEAHGVRGSIDGVRYRLGRADWACPGLSPPDDLAPEQLWLALTREDELIAWIGLQDSLRAQAPACVEALQRHGQRVYIFSGDQAPRVAATARQLGLPAERAMAQLTPAGKLAAVEQMQTRGQRVLMLGDGINDAPVLARADLSIAMGEGSDLACAQADALLLNNHLDLIPRAMAHARRCRVIMRENLLWALLYNLIVVPLAAAGHIPPYLAALGMSGSSLLVVFNARRLRQILPHK